MKKIEIVAAFLATIGFLLKQFNIPFGAALFAMGLSSLAFLYAFGAFYIYKNHNQQEKGTNKMLPRIVIGFIYTFGLLGVLFKWMLWPGYATNLLSGMYGLILILAITLFFDRENPTFKTKAHWIRFVSISIVVVATYLIPLNSIIDFRFRNCPEAAEAFKYYKEQNTEESLENYLKLEQDCELSSN